MLNFILHCFESSFEFTNPRCFQRGTTTLCITDFSKSARSYRFWDAWFLDSVSKISVWWICEFKCSKWCQIYRYTSPRVWRRCEPGGFSPNPRVSAKPGGVFSMPNPATISKAQKIFTSDVKAFVRRNWYKAEKLQITLFVWQHTNSVEKLHRKNYLWAGIEGNFAQEYSERQNTPTFLGLQ